MLEARRSGSARHRLAILAGAVLAFSVATPSVGAPSPTASYIVVLEPDVPAAAIAAAQTRQYGTIPDFVYTHALRGYSARLSARAAAAIAKSPRVAFVTPDERYEWTTSCATTPPSATAQCLPTGVDRIDADASSALAGDVNVAILDSGTDATHPDLNVVGGVNCIHDKKVGATSDPAGHGTHVGGIVGALDNGFGVVGVAPGVRLWSVRVLKANGVGSTATVLCGIDWVTATRSDADPTNDIAVANMSLGAKGSDDGDCGRRKKDVMHLAICASVAAGVTYVASAGNDGTDLAGKVPAAYDEVLTVTAITDYDGQSGGAGSPSCFDLGADDTATPFSNFATAQDASHTIAAPGVCIWSTWPTRYALDSGTSMASPHVAGTVALCIASAACAGLTPAQIIQKLVADAAAHAAADQANGFAGDPLHPVSGKYYGYLVWAGAY